MPTGVMEMRRADMLSVAFKLLLLRGACAISRSNAVDTNEE
jgi:hypothetical protein